MTNLREGVLPVVTECVGTIEGMEVKYGSDRTVMKRRCYSLCPGIVSA